MSQSCWLHVGLHGRLGNTVDAWLSAKVFAEVSGCHTTMSSKVFSHILPVGSSTDDASKNRHELNTTYNCKKGPFLQNCEGVHLDKDGSMTIVHTNQSVVSCMQFRPPHVTQTQFLRLYERTARRVIFRHCTTAKYRSVASCTNGLHLRTGDGRTGSHGYMRVNLSQMQRFATSVDFVAADLEEAKGWARTAYPNATVSNQDAFDDHCSLQRCKRVYAWTFSSFSYTAAKLGAGKYLVRHCSRALDGKCHLYNPTPHRVERVSM